MQSASSSPSLRDLDQLAIAAFSTNGLDPIDDVDECAVTGRFSRTSLPYERLEIQPMSEVRTRTFSHTVRMPLVQAAQRAWFDVPEADLIALEEPAPRERTLAWSWLALIACALALPVTWLLISALPR